jgi:hypothetical protein
MYSGKPAASLVVTELVAERGLGKPEGKRCLNEAGQQAVEATAGQAAGLVDELLQKHWNRTAGAVEETGMPVVQTAVQATCSCGSGIPVQDIVVNGQTVTLIALPLIFQQLHEAGKPTSPEIARELLETVKVYNPIPPGEEEAYAAALSREYAAFCEQQGAIQ